MSDTDSTLEDVTGVGEATSDELRDRGIETVSALADASFGDVAEISGVGEAGAHEIIINAMELDAPDEDTESDSTDDEEYFVIDDPGGIEFTIEISDDLFPYVIHVVLEEAVSQQQSNDFRLRDEAIACARTLARADLSDGDGEYTFIASPGALTTFYRAVRVGSTDYAGRRGISGRYGELEALSDALNEYR